MFLTKRTAKEKKKAVATVLYDYIAQTNNELSLTVGTELKVLQKDPSGWWEVKIGKETGWVPANYLQ